MPRLLVSGHAPLTAPVQAVDQHGQVRVVDIPAERPLTIYLDKRELVTLMTLGAHPDWLVLGYLRNQRLVQEAADIESITIDWDADAAAVRMRIPLEALAARTEHRVVTTGCGQGSVFGSLLEDLEAIRLPVEARITQGELYELLNAIRLQESTYKSAGSVHGCALFQHGRMQLFIEDVGRHNAVDAIAGWMWLQGDAMQGTGGLVFYTTGRLTSEMVIKAAQMGIAIVVSRSGITQMGQRVAAQLGLCAIGRAMNQRFLCYSAPERIELQPELAAAEGAASSAGRAASGAAGP